MTVTWRRPCRQYGLKTINGKYTDYIHEAESGVYIRCLDADNLSRADTLFKSLRLIVDNLDNCDLRCFYQ